MIKKLLLLWVCSIIALPLFASNAPMVSGLVGGNGEIQKKLPLGPDAIVMKDSIGNDVLVVFYRLKGSSQKVGFIVSRGVGENGANLLWDKPHVLKEEVMKAGGFSPAPVMLDGKLYLFGREREKNDGRDLIYNSFENVEDLIAHTEERSGDRSFKELGIKGHKEFDHLSAAVVDGAVLLAYYEKNEKKTSAMPFSSSRCTPKSTNTDLLSCKDVTVPTSKYQAPTVITQVTVNGALETLLFVKDGENTWDIFQLNSAHNEWVESHSIFLYDLKGFLPMGMVEVNGNLHVYYNSKTANILETHVVSDEIFSPDASWTIATRKKGMGGEAFESIDAVKPIIFGDRVYVFFKDLYCNFYDKYGCAEYADKLYYFSDIEVK